MVLLEKGRFGVAAGGVYCLHFTSRLKKRVLSPEHADQWI
jgi:hypothetical protein